MTVFLFATTRQETWQPAADVYRTKWGWLLKFDLAGVRLEDINVHVSRNAVTVNGIRRDWMAEEGCHHHSLEINYSRFERKIELPDDLSGSQIRLDYRDGILMLRVGIDGGKEQ